MLAMKLHIAHLIWSDYIKTGVLNSAIPVFAKKLFYQRGSSNATYTLHLYLHNGEIIDPDMVGIKLVMLDERADIRSFCSVSDPYFNIQDFTSSDNHFYYAYNYTI